MPRLSQNNHATILPIRRRTDLNRRKWRKTHGIEAYGVFGAGWYVSIPGGRKPRHGPGNRVREAFRHGWERRIPVSERWAKKCPDYSLVTRADYVPTSQNEKPTANRGLGMGWIVVNLRVRSGGLRRCFRPVWRFRP